MAEGGRDINAMHRDTGLLDAEDADINDCFDAIEMAGERYKNQGYLEGLDMGKQSGYEEGIALGKKQGWKVGSELGFYHGFARSWRKLAVQDPETKPRVITSLDSLVEMIDRFPLSDPTTVTLQDQLDRIRAKFKQVSSLLNMNAEFGGSGPGGTSTNLSF